MRYRYLALYELTGHFFFLSSMQNTTCGFYLKLVRMCREQCKSNRARRHLNLKLFSMFSMGRKIFNIVVRVIRRVFQNQQYRLRIHHRRHK